MLEAVSRALGSERHSTIRCTYDNTLTLTLMTGGEGAFQSGTSDLAILFFAGYTQGLTLVLREGGSPNLRPHGSSTQKLGAFPCDGDISVIRGNREVADVKRRHGHKMNITGSSMSHLDGDLDRIQSFSTTTPAYTPATPLFLEKESIEKKGSPERAIAGRITQLELEVSELKEAKEVVESEVGRLLGSLDEAFDWPHKCHESIFLVVSAFEHLMKDLRKELKAKSVRERVLNPIEEFHCVLDDARIDLLTLTLTLALTLIVYSTTPG